MPNKKPAKNAFYFYMQDKMAEFRRQGHTVGSIADCVPLAHPRWKAEPKEVKDRYELKAKQHKAKMRGADGDQYRLNNQGVPLCDVKDGGKELEQKREQQKRELKKNWPTGNQVLEEKFFFIHFEYIVHVEDDDTFLPAEVALLEYSVLKGIHRTFDKFIKPGEIRKGWKFDAKSRSENRHKLPYDPDEPFSETWDDNYYSIWNQMCNFLNPQGSKPNYPPIFCLYDEYETRATERCLFWLYEQARPMLMGVEQKIHKVFAIEDLFKSYYDGSRSDKIKATPSDNSLRTELRTTAWDYEPDTCCSYHEEHECKFCALGFVKRWAFAISENLSTSGAYEFNLTEKHIPPKPIPKWATQNQPTFKSMFQSNNYQPPSTQSSQTPSAASQSGFTSSRGYAPLGVAGGAERVTSSHVTSRGTSRGSTPEVKSSTADGTDGIRIPLQPGLVQQSIGRGTSMVGGFGSAKAGNQLPAASFHGHGRGRGFAAAAPPAPPATNAWGSRSASAAAWAPPGFPAGAGSEFEDAAEFPSMGEKEGNVGTNDEFPSLSNNNKGMFWPAMGRGRGCVNDVTDMKPQQPSWGTPGAADPPTFSAGRGRGASPAFNGSGLVNNSLGFGTGPSGSTRLENGEGRNHLSGFNGGTGHSSGLAYGAEPRFGSRTDPGMMTSKPGLNSMQEMRREVGAIGGWGENAGATGGHGAQEEEEEDWG